MPARRLKSTQKPKNWPSTSTRPALFASLNIETRDAKREDSSREELLQGGGALKVPCLRIEDEQGTVSWIYESSEIIDYLDGRFMATTSPV